MVEIVRRQMDLNRLRIPKHCQKKKKKPRQRGKIKDQNKMKPVPMNPWFPKHLS